MSGLTAVLSSLQVTKTAGDIAHACATNGVADIAREGVSPSVLGWLAASTAELVPNALLADGLAVSRALEGTWNSRFMANFMGEQYATTQQALLSEPAGQKLVVYATALAAGATAVRGMLRLPRVGRVPATRTL
jgi:hypothetical protein